MQVLISGIMLALGLSALAAQQTVPMTMYDHAEPVKLPRLFSNFDGSPVENTDDWERKRRPELLDYFTKNVYGERPVERPADLTFTPIGADRVFPESDMVRRQVRLSFSGPRGKGSFVVTAFLPRTADAAKPVPTFVLICNRALEKVADLDRRTKSEFFPPEEIVRRGYAVALFKNTEIARDEYFPSFGPDGTCVLQDPPFTNDVYACWAPERTERSWGAISAWAWGASRVLDWIETVPELDAKRVAVVGHSRGGKTALWAAASDSRFAMACVNDSGCCGAKLNHVALPFAETIQQDNAVNPHWFCRAFRRFNGQDAYLPHDQHWIAALVAPRLLYIASASEDFGAGPWGEFLTARYASPAWGLYGVRGLVEDHPYRIGDPFHGGRVGYHLRKGGHDLNLFDWKNYMDFADRHLKGKSLATGPKRLEGRNAKPLDLQTEVDRVSAAGGGTVRVPAGEWLSKPLVLRPHVTLELDEKAILFASTNLADYAHLPRGQRYFIFADRADDVAIRGRGTLCGRGWAFRESRQLEGSSQPQDLPVMLRFSRCRNLTLEDFTYRDGGAWGCHLRNCDGVTMRRVKCHNHVNNTNDGLDIESSNVTVEDCDIDANDDALCFKTESDKTFPVTNVVVRNSRFASTCNGVKFGTGSYCDVKDILIENCDFYRPTARYGTDRSGVMPGVTNRLCGLAGLALEVVDGGRMDGVTIRNVTIDGYLTPVFIRMNNRHDAPAGVTTCLRNVLIENVKATVADSYIASSITGIPGFRPSDITLRNVDLLFPGGGRPEDAVRPVPEMEKAYPECTMFHLGWPDHADPYEAVLPAWGFYLRHADNVTFDRVRLRCVGVDARQPIVTEDCRNFQVKQGPHDTAPFVILRSYGLYEANRSYTERVFAAQERHPGLIDEIWFAGCGDPFSTPDEMGRAAAQGNLAVRERCNRLGIRFSYQDGVTLNHGQDGIRRAGIPEDAWAVDRDGKTMYGVFCCTSPFVKDFCREKAKAILSALRPASYWPDDDLRMNKGGRPPASCFCSRCLGLFGARVGKPFDREGLLAELTGPAASAETRRAWCAFNGEMLGAFAKVYREAADAVSPETLVGQQLTVTLAAVNGDGWRRILEAYGAGGHATGVRPGGGYYSDQNPFSLVGKMVDVAKTAARASRLGCVKQVCYEAETWPHIGSLKNPGGLMAECAYALAVGCDSLALYWGSDINGETAESHDFFFDTLAAWKPFLLAEREAFRGTVPGGLAQFIGADRFADDEWTSTFDVQDAVPLARNGIPLADAEGSPDAFFLNARSVRTFSRGDFATVFAKPVLMDVETFSALAARFPDLGFVKKVGIGEPPVENAPATDSRPAGYERFAGGRCEGVRGLIRPQAADVVRLSEMTADPAACGTCVIPTEFGGAVVLVQDMSFKSYSWAGPQMSWAGCRRHGILDALDRAVPGRLPARLLTDGYACVVLARKTPDGRTAGVFVMNFGTGETPPLELGIRRTAVRDWTVLGPHGRVTASGRADGDGTVIRLPPLPAFGVAVAVANCEQE